jgi:hypothetical protein
MILGSDPGMVNEWDGDLKPSEMFGTALSGGRLRVGWKGSETGKDTGVGEFSRSSNHSQSPTPTMQSGLWKVK